MKKHIKKVKVIQKPQLKLVKGGSDIVIPDDTGT